LAFVIAYIFIFGAGIYYITKLIRKGPGPTSDIPEYYAHGIEASITHTISQLN
jgi:cytochrome bd-type quinol oxidase subunit 1